MKGKLIVFEGGEGCGKSTQQEFLKNYLKNKGYDNVVVTREPGGTKLSEKLRKILLYGNNINICDKAELLMFETSRAQYIYEILKPNLEQGKVLLTDRFYHSSIVYQGYGRNLDINVIKMINSYVTEGIKPDFTFILDLPVEIGIKRAAEATGKKIDRFEKEKIDFLERVRQGYLDLPKLLPDENIMVIDGNLSKEKIFENIKYEINNLLYLVSF